MSEELILEERATLLRLAREAIRDALNHKAGALTLDTLPPNLQKEGAAFVTLTLHGNLRGCIGSLVAHRPLALDVQQNALAAAFEDPRFPPVSEIELPSLEIEISVLSPSEPLAFESPEDLLQKLQPEIDGVVLTHGYHRATFLPQVWEQLPDPEEFLGHLCRKAGLPANAWRWPDIEISIYHVEKFEED